MFKLKKEVAQELTWTLPKQVITDLAILIFQQRNLKLITHQHDLHKRIVIYLGKEEVQYKIMQGANSPFLVLMEPGAILQDEMGIVPREIIIHKGYSVLLKKQEINKPM